MAGVGAALAGDGVPNGDAAAGPVFADGAAAPEVPAPLGVLIPNVLMAQPKASVAGLTDAAGLAAPAGCFGDEAGAAAGFANGSLASPGAGFFADAAGARAGSPNGFDSVFAGGAAFPGPVDDFAAGALASGLVGSPTFGAGAAGLETGTPSACCWSTRLSSRRIASYWALRSSSDRS